MMTKLSPYQKFVLKKFDLSKDDKERLTQSILEYQEADGPDGVGRESYVAPFDSWGWPITAWTLLRMGVDSPLLIAFGIPLALVCILIMTIQLLWFLVSFIPRLI